VSKEVPHSPQNFLPARACAPQLGHAPQQRPAVFAELEALVVLSLAARAFHLRVREEANRNLFLILVDKPEHGSGRCLIETFYVCFRAN